MSADQYWDAREAALAALLKERKERGQAAARLSQHAAARR